MQALSSAYLAAIQEAERPAVGPLGCAAGELNLQHGVLARAGTAVTLC